MQNFLKKIKYYNGNNQTLISFAKKAQDLLDRYDDMVDLLDSELDEQEELRNRSYTENRAEHERLYQNGLFDM